MQETRTIQQIFTLLIERGRYHPNIGGMCTVLQLAAQRGEITKQEQLKCRDAIEDYMMSLVGVDDIRDCPMYLRSVFRLVGLPYHNENLIDTYAHWEDRPLNPHKRNHPC